jgi:LacI family transcriptional regulator
MKYEVATIKDIAKALGLSTSTVSRALRDSYEISAATKQQVLNYAKQINYRPNPAALSLKERKTGSIGIIVGEIANSFFSQVINGVECIAREKGYTVIIAQSLESYEHEVSGLQFLASRSVDGCLVSVASETKDFSHFSSLSQRGFPMVFYDRVIEEFDAHKITSDNFTGAYQATTHLLKNGYRKIAFMAHDEKLFITKKRLEGYKKALADNGIAFDNAFVKYCPYGGMLSGEAEHAFNELFTAEEKPDAIFTSSDKLTTLCMRLCSNAEIFMPAEIGLIGFSNLDNTEFFSPALSVIRQPAFEMGRIAAEMLIKTIESKHKVEEYENVVLPVELIARNSTPQRTVHLVA